MSRSTRERLIDAATELFFQHGFHAVGLDQILGEVGVTKTTFYNHFDSRDALIEAVIARQDQIELTDWWSRIAEWAGDDPRAQLEAIFEVMHAWLGGESFRGCLFIAAAVEFPNPHDPAHSAAARHMQRLCKEIEKRAAAAGARDPQALAEDMMTLILGALTQRLVNNDLNAARVAERALPRMLAEQFAGSPDAVASRPAEADGRATSPRLPSATCRRSGPASAS